MGSPLLPLLANTFIVELSPGLHQHVKKWRCDVDDTFTYVKIEFFG